MKFILERSDDFLITPTGLSFAGAILDKVNFNKKIDMLKVPDNLNPAISHSSVLKSYIGLLCQGKNDYDHIEAYRDDDFFEMALDIEKIPSSSTMRQRMNQIGEKARNILLAKNAEMIKASKAEISPCYKNYIPLDIDVSPFDNSNSKKEGVSRTYKGTDGYAPIFSYLGEEGYLINTELREGKTHSQKNTPAFIKESILKAKRITCNPLLIRMDSGFDSADNIKVCLHKDSSSDFIIKRNLRQESVDLWLTTAMNLGEMTHPREGKWEYTGDLEAKPPGIDKNIRMIFKVIKRTILSDGQMLIIPDIEAETYWTSLIDATPEKVIDLYHQHGTSEQFHSELKTDMDIERFPSGYFKTNALILELGMIAYNILRIIGQESLKKPDSPLRNNVQRRRIRTVIQNLVTIASKLVTHSRNIYLKFGRNDKWFDTFARVYAAFT
jgi:hypothetical protein